VPAGNAVRVLRSGAVLLFVPLLAGCPIPVPGGYEAGSRENVPAESMDWIAAGTTTREEVLMRLGEADAAAPDGSWLAYGSAYSEGGVVFVIFASGSAAGAGGEHMEYRRLIVRFDQDAKVAHVDLVTRECWQAIVAIDGADGRSAPCLDIRSAE